MQENVSHGKDGLSSHAEEYESDYQPKISKLPPGFWTQFGVTLSVAMMHFACGVILGYTGIILPSVTKPSTDEIYMDTQQVSTYTSIMIIGCLLGSLISGDISIRFGQKLSMLMSIPLYLTGWMISYFSYQFSMHIFSRILLGAALSIGLGCSATYITETVDSSVRGQAMGITDFMRQIGMFLVFLVGSSNMNWRTVGLVCGLVPFSVPCIILMLVPNSPRWLAIKGRRDEEIQSSLRFFRGKQSNIQAELHQIREDVQKMKKNQSTWTQLKALREKSLAKIFLLLVYLNISMSFSGSYVSVAYSAYIFESTKTGISPYTSTVLCGAVSIFASILYILLANRFGRRPLLIIFTALCGICTAVLGLYFYLIENDYNTSSINWLPLVSLLLFTVFSCLSLPVIRMLRCELLPNNVRHLGANMLYFLFFASTYVVSLTYPFMERDIGAHWAFWIYSLISVFTSAIVFFFLPETKGKTLEEIISLFK